MYSNIIKTEKLQLGFLITFIVFIISGCNRFYPFVDEGFDVQIQAIEVTQGVRTDIPTRTPPTGLNILTEDSSTKPFHVAERRTIVRVYPWVQVGSGSTVPSLSAKLYGFDNSGFELPDSPLNPQNITLIPDPEVQSLPDLRKEAARSWNFVLPTSWTTAGQIRLEATANPPGSRFASECDNCDNNNKVSLFGTRFTTTGQVSFIPFVVNWANVASDGTVVRVSPTLAQVAIMFRHILKIWPIAELDIRYFRFVDTCIPNGGLCIDPYTDGPGRIFGVGGTPSPSSPQGQQRDLRDRSAFSNITLIPAFQSGNADLRFNVPGVIKGCRGVSGVPGIDYWLSGACNPVFAHESAHAGPARNHAGSIHGGSGGVDASYPDPHGAVEANAYGFDIFAMQAIAPTISSTHSDDYMVGINPGPWTSRYTWDGIRTWLDRQVSLTTIRAKTSKLVSQTQKNAKIATQETTPYLRLRGQIETEGNSNISPVFQVELPTGTGDSPGQGSYELTLIDGAGKTAFVRQFEPQILRTHTHGASDDVEMVAIHFMEYVPLFPGLSEVILSHNGQVLARRTALPDVPEINLLTPKAGEKWANSGTATVSWNVDSGGDNQLSFLVEGSHDGGATWTLLSGSEGGTEAEVDLTNLPGAGLDWTIRVQASDGLNTGVAEAKPIEIAAKPPQVFVLNPGNGDTVNLTQKIVLMGQGFDWLDGQLSDDRLIWQVNGETIGKGKEVTISGLPEGEHTITLQANNSSGLKSTMSVKFSVADDADFDGLPNAWEKMYNLDTLTPNASEDPDGDGLVNWRELDAGTSPIAADTDNDNFSDQEEILTGSDPLDSKSTPRS